jgi:hypothetical protein
MSQKPHKRIIFCIFETTVCRFFRILGNQPNGSHLYSAGDTPTGTQIIDLTWGNTPFFLLVFSWNINYVDFYDSSIIISSLNQRKEAMYNLILYKAKRRTEPTGHCVQRFLYLGFKFIPAAQHSADITASWHIRCQFTPDLADDTGNGSTAAFAVFIPYSLVNLAG